MKCPICDSNELRQFDITTREEKESRKMKLEKCFACGVIFSEDFETDRTFIYGNDYAAWNTAKKKINLEYISEAKKKAFLAQLGNIFPKICQPKGSLVLDIGAGGGYLLECLNEKGCECYGTEISNFSAEILEQKFPSRIRTGGICEATFSDDFFDIIFLTDVLEHLPYPKKELKEVARILKPGGHLFIISPNSDSWTRKILGKNWFQYKYEHIFYYNRKSLGRLLRPLNFSETVFKNNSKKFSLNYYAAYFQKYSFFGIGTVLKFIFPYLSASIKNVCFNNPLTGEFLAIYQKKK